MNFIIVVKTVIRNNELAITLTGSFKETLNFITTDVKMKPNLTRFAQLAYYDSTELAKPVYVYVFHSPERCEIIQSLIKFICNSGKVNMLINTQLEDLLSKTNKSIDDKVNNHQNITLYVISKNSMKSEILYEIYTNFVESKILKQKK